MSTHTYQHDGGEVELELADSAQLRKRTVFLPCAKHAPMFATMTRYRRAADYCRAQCIQDLDYIEVFDGPYYGASGEDEAPLLVADWLGHPAVTIRTEA